MTPPPPVTFVIPVRNDATRLRRCLESIRQQDGGSACEVVVVDNGSVDDSATVASAAGATVLSLPQAKVSAARNAGAQRATSDLLAFVDADHILDPAWLSAVPLVLGDNTVDGAGAPYSSPPDANWVQRAYAGFRPALTTAEPTDWLGSGNLVIRRTAFNAVRGFDVTLESCEDVDLCNRLIGSGHHLVADPRLRSIHLGDPKTLRALFFGELWRGRDNIRVTLRGKLTPAALPSVLIPIIDLVAILSLVVSPWSGVRTALIGTGVFGLFSLLRAVRMSRRQVSGGWRSFIQNLVVAAVYDAARACALVLRATHRTRREVAGERAVA